MDGAGCGLLQKRFDFRECELDRVEVRAVGRQEQHDGPGSLDRLTNGDWLVCRQIIKDDDVAWPERRDQDLLDIGEEGGAGHRAVDGHRRHDALQRDGADERGRFPMAVRDRGTATFASRRAAIHASHLGRRPALVDKHETRWIQIGLAVEPGAAAAGYVRAVLP